MQYVQSINIQRKVITMCGRYYIDSDMEDEIEKVVNDIDQGIWYEHFVGDIFPTNDAPILEKSEHELKLDVCKWGYPVSQVKKSDYKCKSRICYGQTFFSKWNSLSPYIDTSKWVL